MVELGNKLRQLRKARNLTQQQLAVQIGVNKAMISFYELGDRIPSPEILRKLAFTLHTTTDYLLGIERSATIDASGLNEQDRLVVETLVTHLREKNLQN